MIAVVSRCRTLDTPGATEAYVAGSADFLEWLRDQPGFRGRLLLADRDDPRSFTHVRLFDSVEDYEAMVLRPGYAERIEALGAHLDLETVPTKSYADVALADGFAG